MMEWQPIETAPKDQEVLTYGPLRDGSGHYQEVQKMYQLRGVWPVTFMHNALSPTHWMPLPAPPLPP